MTPDPPFDQNRPSPPNHRTRPEESTPGSRASEVVDQIRGQFADQLTGIYTFYPVCVEEYDHDTQRVTLTLTDQPEVTLSDVPVTTPHAGSGVGEIYPIEPGVTRGFAGFSKIPLDEILDERGASYEHAVTRDRQFDVEDAIFLPAQHWFGDDDVPDHQPGDRLIAHPTGTIFRIHEATGDVDLLHPTAGEIRLRTTPPYKDGEFEMEDVLNAPTFPDPATGYLNLTHPSGAELSVSEAGVAIQHGENEKSQQIGRFTEGAPNDPRHVNHADHRHLVPKADGTYELTGPPIQHRELFQYFLGDASADVQNRDAPEFETVEETLAAYLAWVESMTGQTVDVNAPETVPDPLPLPDAETRREFDPTPERVDSFETGGLDAYTITQGAEGVAVTTGPAVPTHESRYSLALSERTVELLSTTGLPEGRYPRLDETYRYHAHTTAGSEVVDAHYFVQDAENSYFVRLDFTTDELTLYERVENDENILAQYDLSDDLSLAAGAWYAVEVTPGADGIHTVEFFKQWGATPETPVASITNDEPTLAFTSGGIGWGATLATGETVYFDDAYIT